MKDAHREKLRQLPRERKLYLLQQNQHIKENRAVDSSLRKSMPTSNSTTSIFPHKGLRTKTTAAMKRSETSGRLLMGNSASHRSLATSLIANSSIEDLSALPVYEEAAAPPSPMPTPTSPHFPSQQQQHQQQQQQKQRYQQGGQKKNNQSNHISKKETSVHCEQPGATTCVGTTPIAKSPKPSTTTAYENDPSTTAKSVTISSPPTSPTANGPTVDKRAATYKYARKNLTSTVRSNRSKVGSMVLEFDALATKLEDTTSDESAAWLLLDNKTLPRHYNMNTGTTRSNHINHHPSVSNLFPTASTTMTTPSETASHSSVHVTGTSASSSLLSNSYAYQSLSRKDGSHLASLVSSSSPALDDSIKRGRDRNSPYYYVERIKSR